MSKAAAAGGTIRRFHDRHHAFQFLVGRAIGEMIARDPSLVERARESLATSVGLEPQHAHIRAIWCELLERAPDEIAFELMRDDERGDIVRQTRPPFIALTARHRADLIVQARKLTA